MVDKPQMIVWDYTQNYENRANWDDSVVSASVFQTTPNRIVKLNMRANTTMLFVYKHDDRPNKTTLTATEIKSSFIESAGGSWTYETKNNGTLWSQSNIIILKKHFLLPILFPFIKWFLVRQTIKAMTKAKNIMEQN